MTAVAKLPELWERAANATVGADEASEAQRHVLQICADHLRAALSPAELGGVGADFDKWYGSCDARLWNNWDACKAAYIAGQKSKAKLDGVPPIREGENIHGYGARCFESGYAQASMLALSAAPAGLSEWQRVDSTPRAAEAVAWAGISPLGTHCVSVSKEAIEIQCYGRGWVVTPLYASVTRTIEAASVDTTCPASALTPPSAKGENSNV